MSIQVSMTYLLDTNGVLPEYRPVFEDAVSHGFSKAVILWDGPNYRTVFVTELEDALDRLQTWGHEPLTVQVVTDLAVAVDAARQLANGTPTYLVYTRQDDVEYLGHIYQGEEAQRMADNPNLPGEWFTALGITMKEEGEIYDGLTPEAEAENPELEDDE